MGDPRLTERIAPLLEQVGPGGYLLLEQGDRRSEELLSRATEAIDGDHLPLVVILGCEPRPDELERPDRELLYLPPFGGAVLSLSTATLAVNNRLRAAWQQLVEPRELIEVLERERRRLKDELAAARRDHDELLVELESAIAQLEANEAELRPLHEGVEKAAVQIRALARRTRALERRAAKANSLAATAHEQLVIERAWVADQARSVAASQSWRLGHRLVRLMRSATLRHDRGADGLTVILRKMEDGSEGARTR